MNEQVKPGRIEAAQVPFPVFELWKKYEDIAMHFNDLLIKLRMQALGGVAALATVVSIFTKVESENVKGSWEIAAFVFGALCLIWLAIFLLDLMYYHRLLVGAVIALTEVEKATQEGIPVNSIAMSTRIEEAVWKKNKGRPPFKSRLFLMRGVYCFYGIVGASLVTGFFISLHSAGLLSPLGTYLASWVPGFAT